MNSMHGWHLHSARTLSVMVVPLGLAALLGAAACTDAPESLDQQGQAVISDAVHGPEASRVAGFYFLPPVVPRPALRGAFVPEVSPTVQIDRIDPATGATLRAIATFTRAGDHDGAAIRVRRQGERCEGDDEDGAADEPNGYFWVRWRTRGLHLSTDAKYRIRVSVPGGRELGFADIRVVDRERDRRAIERNEFVALRRDHALVIRFRIDRPAVDGDGDGVFDWDDNCPAVANADQRDSVGDHVGDACRCLGVSCAASDACHLTGTCSPTTGVCSSPVAPDGTACGAGQVCRAAVCVSLALPPRLIAPLSTATVTSRTPTLRWSLAPGSDGARVQLCRDRACNAVIATLDAIGANTRPASDLPTGTVFWRAFGRAGGSAGTVASATWQFTVGARSAPVDTSWGTTPDVNGDGYADVIVGAPNANGGAGRMHVYLGGARPLTTVPAMSLDGRATGDAFGTSVASAGDINGDGYADVVVGAPASYYAGRAYVYLGGSDGLATSPAATLEGNGYFGMSVASAGDVNGDGYADVVVGAPFANLSEGRTFIYFGGAEGLRTGSVSVLENPVPLGPHDVMGTVFVWNENFGRSVASAGDVNGDGYADIVVGSSEMSRRAYVFLGAPGGVAPHPTTSLADPLDEDPFGRSVAGAGDVNGDGYADIIVGSPGFRGTAHAFVYLGAASGIPTVAAATLAGPVGGPLDNGYTGFGEAVAGAGDVNGDGYADVILGASTLNLLRGYALIYVGGAGGLATSPALTFGQPPEWVDPGCPATGVPCPFFDYPGRFGTSVAGAGDVDGDGYSDIIVGAPGFGSRDGRELGPHSHLFWGSTSVLALSSAVTFSYPDGAASGFGASVASAVAVPPGRPRDHHSSPTSLPASAGPRPPRASAAVCMAPHRASVPS